MQYLPIFLKLSGRKVTVVGGGETAARKVRLLLKTDADIWIVAPKLDPELADLAARGRVRHVAEPLAGPHFKDAAFAFVATDCAGADAAAKAIAGSMKVAANVVDAPDLCDAVMPAIVDRDPVVVAIGTEGTAPVLARLIKSRVEELLEPRLGDLAALAGRLRRSARRLSARERRSLWRWVFDGPPRAAHRAGREREAAQLIKARLESGEPPEAAAGFVSLVGAGPGAPDMITLRGAQRLQEADVIFYDRLANPELLELARRDAEFVFVGKEPGQRAWPQERINGVIVAAARQGKRVVRLKCGDPGVFGRLEEELAAINAAGISREIVPGVTAASAAAAAAGRSLTSRGEMESLVLTTGRCRDGDAAPDWAAQLRPGVAMSVYMGVKSAAALRQNLLAAGIPAETPVEIAGSVGGAEQRVVESDLAHFVEAMTEARVSNPAVITIRRSKKEAVASVAAA